MAHLLTTLASFSAWTPRPVAMHNSGKACKGSSRARAAAQRSSPTPSSPQSWRSASPSETVPFMPCPPWLQQVPLSLDPRKPSFLLILSYATGSKTNQLPGHWWGPSIFKSPNQSLITSGTWCLHSRPVKSTLQHLFYSWGNSS